jgi:hypothetical protein
MPRGSVARCSARVRRRTVARVPPPPTTSLPRSARSVLALTAVLAALLLGVGLVRWVVPAAWFHLGEAAYRAELHRPARVLLGSFARTFPHDERSATAVMFVLDDCTFTDDWAALSKELATFEADPQLRAVLEAQAPLR